MTVEVKGSEIRNPDQYLGDSLFDKVMGPYDRRIESVENLHDIETTYGMFPAGDTVGPDKGVPRDDPGLSSPIVPVTVRRFFILINR